MLRWLALLSALFAFGCTHPEPHHLYDGPPWLDCKVRPTQQVKVDQVVTVSCFLGGGIEHLTDLPTILLYELPPLQNSTTVVMAAYEPQRLYEWPFRITRAQYEELTGTGKLDPWSTVGRPEILDPHDPSAPPPPIEGIEGSLSGRFRMVIALYELVGFNQETGGITVGRQLATAKKMMVVDCPLCPNIS